MELRVTLQKRFGSFLLDVDFTVQGGESVSSALRAVANRPSWIS